MSQIFAIKKVFVVKSVVKTVVIIVIIGLSTGNEAWGDYRISKVQSRSQILSRFWSKRRHWYDCDQVGSYFIQIIDCFIHNIFFSFNTLHVPLM